MGFSIKYNFLEQIIRILANMDGSAGQFSCSLGMGGKWEIGVTIIQIAIPLILPLSKAISKKPFFLKHIF